MASRWCTPRTRWTRSVSPTESPCCATAAKWPRSRPPIGRAPADRVDGGPRSGELRRPARKPWLDRLRGPRSSRPFEARPILGRLTSKFTRGRSSASRASHGRRTHGTRQRDLWPRAHRRRRDPHRRASRTNRAPVGRHSQRNRHGHGGPPGSAGIVPRMSVGENLTLASLDAISAGPWIDRVTPNPASPANRWTRASRLKRAARRSLSSASAAAISRRS